MHSYAGGKRVFILGDVEFTREAANALLKFFEEPPGDVLLLLTTSSASRLLPTVRSRLVEVTFAPLSDAEVAALLEREGIEPDVAARVASAAGGSVTRARGLLDGEGTTRDAAIAWFFAIVTGEEADANAWATRATLDDGLDVLKTLTRDWLALRISPDAPLLAPDVAYRLETLPERDPATIVRALAALGDAERIAQSNVSPALIADLAKMALVTR
jgi:DNA polymerase-3 subunit delta'